jgi:tRNA-(ms[2]io[6]A)-hydroxylase
VNIVESNIEEILTDHAWCEQKAASNAIYIIVNNSEKEELVTEMTRIALEEMEHFQMVHDIIKEKRLTLGRERKDNYVKQEVASVSKYFQKTFKTLNWLNSIETL